MDIPITFVPGKELVFTTRNSTWIVREDKYKRSSLTGPRPALQSLDGSGQDDRWEEHQGAWVGEASDEMYLRVLPAGRPANFQGLKSSAIAGVEEREFDDSDES